MGTQTPHLSLVKPTVNGPETANTWGVDINANFDKIDAWAGSLPARIVALERVVQELAARVAELEGRQP